MNSIVNVPNIGKQVIEVFSAAGIRTVNDIFVYDMINDTRLADAINKMQQDKAMETHYWIRLNERCLKVLTKIQNPDAIPYVPNYFMCPLTLDILWDPVITPSGYSYERKAISEFIRKYGIDPFTKNHLKENDLIPNIQLKEAVSHYRTISLKYPV
jgi:hypothetical protein